MKNQEEKRLPDKLADGLSGIMIIICVIIFAVMVFAVSYGVIGRYIPFIKNPRWTQELAILCMVWLCFLGSGYGIKEGLHVRTSLLCLYIIGGSQYHVDHLWNSASGADKKSENVSNWMAYGNYVSFCGSWGHLWSGDVSVPCLERGILGHECDSNFNFNDYFFCADLFGIPYFLFHDGFCGSYDPLPGAFSYTGGEYYGRWN